MAPTPTPTPTSSQRKQRNHERKKRSSQAVRTDQGLPSLAAPPGLSPSRPLEQPAASPPHSELNCTHCIAFESCCFAPLGAPLLSTRIPAPGHCGQWPMAIQRSAKSSVTPHYSDGCVWVCGGSWWEAGERACVAAGEHVAPARGEARRAAAPLLLSCIIIFFIKFAGVEVSDEFRHCR